MAESHLIGCRRVERCQIWPGSLAGLKEPRMAVKIRPDMEACQPEIDLADMKWMDGDISLAGWLTGGDHYTLLPMWMDKIVPTLLAALLKSKKDAFQRMILLVTLYQVLHCRRFVKYVISLMPSAPRE